MLAHLKWLRHPNRWILAGDLLIDLSDLKRRLVPKTVRPVVELVPCNFPKYQESKIVRYTKSIHM